MAEPVNLKSDEKVHGHIDGFVDDQGNPATVDAPPRWVSSDESVFKTIVSADGMDVDVVPEDMPQDAPVQTATLTLEADEGGVANAITQSFDVVVSSLASPNAVGVNVSFGPPSPKNP